VREADLHGGLYQQRNFPVMRRATAPCRICGHASISMGRALACIFISALIVCGLALSWTSPKNQLPFEPAIKRRGCIFVQDQVDVEMSRAY
jgi:hypothetical protein